MPKSETIKVFPHPLHLFPLARITSFAGFRSNPEYKMLPQLEQIISRGNSVSGVSGLIIKVSENLSSG